MKQTHLIAALMSFVAATLVVMSSLHLTGALGEGSEPFDRFHAGVAEALIAVVLTLGAGALLRTSAHPSGSGGAPALALASTSFAIAGFVIGLNFTIRGGGLVDMAYHATVFPLLLFALAALLRMRGGFPRSAPQR